MIEAAPPEMHRAYFADEARAKLLKDIVDANQRPPESIDVLGVVRLVNPILIETDWIWNLNRHRPNLYVHFQAMKRGKYFLIEVGD